MAQSWSWDSQIAVKKKQTYQVVLIFKILIVLKFNVVSFAGFFKVKECTISVMLVCARMIQKFESYIHCVFSLCSSAALD